jgi:hypothetical protein
MIKMPQSIESATNAYGSDVTCEFPTRSSAKLLQTAKFGVQCLDRYRSCTRKILTTKVPKNQSIWRPAIAAEHERFFHTFHDTKYPKYG